MNISHCSKLLVTLTAAASLLLSEAALAEAGHIRKLQGEVSIMRDRARLPARVGMAVEPRDRIVTGASGAVGWVTTDQTTMTLGPNSQMVVEEYAFNRQTNQGSFAMRFLKGTFAVISGLLGKVAPDSTKYATPTATIGVRGTEFSVAIEVPPELEEKIVGGVFESAPNTEPESARPAPQTPASAQ